MEISRRNDISRYTTEELAIRECVIQVENLGAHLHLTRCVTLLLEAKNALADWIDKVPAKEPLLEGKEEEKAPDVYQLQHVANELNDALVVHEKQADKVLALLEEGLKALREKHYAGAVFSCVEARDLLRTLRDVRDVRTARERVGQSDEKGLEGTLRDLRRDYEELVFELRTVAGELLDTGDRTPVELVHDLADAHASMRIERNLACRQRKDAEAMLKEERTQFADALQKRQDEIARLQQSLDEECASYARLSANVREDEQAINTLRDKLEFEQRERQNALDSVGKVYEERDAARAECERLREKERDLADVTVALRDVADDLLGLQPADEPLVDLVHGIADAEAERRIERNAARQELKTARARIAELEAEVERITAGACEDCGEAAHVEPHEGPRCVTCGHHCADHYPIKTTFGPNGCTENGCSCTLFVRPATPPADAPKGESYVPCNCDGPVPRYDCDAHGDIADLIRAEERAKAATAIRSAREALIEDVVRLARDNAAMMQLAPENFIEKVRALLNAPQLDTKQGGSASQTGGLDAPQPGADAQPPAAEPAKDDRSPHQRHDTDDGPCECGAWHQKPVKDGVPLTDEGKREELARLEREKDLIKKAMQDKKPKDGGERCAKCGGAGRYYLGATDFRCDACDSERNGPPLKRYEPTPQPPTREAGADEWTQWRALWIKVLDDAIEEGACDAKMLAEYIDRAHAAGKAEGLTLAANVARERAEALLTSSCETGLSDDEFNRRRYKSYGADDVAHRIRALREGGK